MSFLYSYLSSWWESLWLALGLKHKEGTLLLLGLDNAGKTTLLHRLRTGSIQSFPPTDRPHASDSFRYGKMTLQVWDLGGHEAVRHMWQDYVCECKAILFVIDAADVERLDEVGYELDALLSDGVLEGLPIALLLNKCDLDVAANMSSDEICQRFHYQDLVALQGDETKMKVFRISVLRGEGYPEAFQWISQFL